MLSPHEKNLGIRTRFHLPIQVFHAWNLVETYGRKPYVESDGRILVKPMVDYLTSKAKVELVS